MASIGEDSNITLIGRIKKGVMRLYVLNRQCARSFIKEFKFKEELF